MHGKSKGMRRFYYIDHSRRRQMAITVKNELLEPTPRSIHVHLRAHVHGDSSAKFVEYAGKIQRNATFLLHRPFTVTTDSAQVMQEKSHVVVRNGKTRG